MSLRFLEGALGEQLRSDLSHATTLEELVLYELMQVTMSFVASGQDLDKLLASVAELSQQHGVNPTLLKYSARALVHISLTNSPDEPCNLPFETSLSLFLLFCLSSLTVVLCL